MNLEDLSEYCDKPDTIKYSRFQELNDYSQLKLVFFEILYQLEGIGELYFTFKGYLLE